MSHTQDQIAANDSEGGLDQSAQIDAAKEEQEVLQILEEKVDEVEMVYAKCEAVCRDLGMDFLWYPLEYREALMADLIRFFLGDEANPQPDLINDLKVIRDLKEGFSNDLRRRNAEKALSAYLDAKSRVFTLQNKVRALHEDLGQAAEVYHRGYAQHNYADEGLPVLDPGMLIDDFQGPLEGKLAEVRTWIGMVPEIDYGVRIGAMAIQPEVEDALRQDQIEDRNKAIDELELSDIELLDYSEEDEEDGAED